MIARFRGNLLLQFALTSLAVIAAIGLVLGWLVGYMIERNALDDAAAEATQTLSSRVIRRLGPEDFIRPMTGQRYADFDKFVEEQIVSGRTARIKIWGRTGTVIYSDDQSQVGERFPIKDELAEALRGKIATEVSDLHASENAEERQYGRLLEVYAPVALAGYSQVVGAFEIYQFYEPVASYIQSAQRSLYLSLGFGLLLLYSALFILVKRGHDTIQRQRGELAALYRIGQHIHSTLELGQVLRNIIAEATTLVRGQAGLLMLVDAGKEELTPASAYNIPEDDKLARSLPIGKGLPGKALLEGKSIVASHETRPRAEAGPFPRSTMYVPLSYRDRATGVICIDSFTNQRAFREHDIALVEDLAGQAAIAIEQANLLQTSQDRANALHDAYRTTLGALSAALDLRDGGTEQHSQRVADRMRTVATEMGVPEDEQEAMVMGALLHDVGKIGVPDAILRKPGPLDSEEWAIMRQHPVAGHRMLVSIPFLSTAAPIVYHHHERWDGGGYPGGIRGEEIPLGARIFAVLDTYDAITSDRPYRKGNSHAAAIAEIHRVSGSQFDPRVVEAFCRVCQQFAG